MRGVLVAAAIASACSSSPSTGSYDGGPGPPGAGGIASATSGSGGVSSGGSVAAASGGGSIAAASGGASSGGLAGSGGGSTAVVDGSAGARHPDAAISEDGGGGDGCPGSDCSVPPAVPLPGTPRTWKDPASGLTWSDPPATGRVAAAVTYCNALVLDGHDDFRLPTIDELRTLVRGCAASTTGGACGVTNACNALYQCYGGCYACEEGKGPSSACYSDAAVAAHCGSFWSSTAKSDTPDANWNVNFYIGNVMWMYDFVDVPMIRCVR